MRKMFTASLASMMALSCLMIPSVNSSAARTIGHSVSKGKGKISKSKTYKKTKTIGHSYSKGKGKRSTSKTLKKMPKFSHGYGRSSRR